MNNKYQKQFLLQCNLAQVHGFLEQGLKTASKKRFTSGQNSAPESGPLSTLTSVFYY